MKRLILVLLLLLSACQRQPAPAQIPVVPMAWIDAPLDGSRLPLEPATITAHFYHPAGISQVELSVDGAVVSTSPSPGGATPFTSIELPWQPAAPGRHQLSVRAQSPAGEWSAAATAEVEIAGAAEIAAAPAATPTPAATQPPGPTQTSAPASPTSTPPPTATQRAAAPPPSATQRPPAPATAPPATAAPAASATPAPIRATATSAPPTSGPPTSAPATATSAPATATSAPATATPLPTRSLPTVTPPAPPTAELSADPTSITAGSCATLVWRTTNAESVSLNGAPVEASGQQQVCPEVTTTYSLAASNAAGKISREVTISVSSPPPSLGRPSASTDRFATVAGCDIPTEITISVVAENLGDGSVTVFYRVAEGRWLSQAMRPGRGGFWSRTLQSGVEVPTDITGPFEYYIFATSGAGQQAQTEVYGGISYVNCKP